MAVPVRKRKVHHYVKEHSKSVNPAQPEPDRRGRPTGIFAGLPKSYASPSPDNDPRRWCTPSLEPEQEKKAIKKRGVGKKQREAVQASPDCRSSSPLSFCSAPSISLDYTTKFEVISFWPPVF